MRRRVLGLTVLALLAASIASAPGAATQRAEYAAHIGGVVLPSFVRGEVATANVTVTNIGSASWSASNVFLSYHWLVADDRTATYGLAQWDGLRTSLGSDLAPGGSRTVPMQIRALDRSDANREILQIDLVREGVAWFGAPLGVFADLEPAVTRAGYVYGSEGSGGKLDLGAEITTPITVVNTGNTMWSASDTFLSYHWRDLDGRMNVWDGLRTSFGSDVRPGESRAVAVRVAAPPVTGWHTLQIDIVREGVMWFWQYAGPANPYVPPAEFYFVSASQASYGAVTIPPLYPGTEPGIPVTVTNVGTTTWQASGDHPVHLAYHIYRPYQGPNIVEYQLVVWDGYRAPLPGAIAPGETVTIELPFGVPQDTGDYIAVIDMVQEGIGWFSDPDVRRIGMQDPPTTIVGAAPLNVSFRVIPLGSR